MAISSKLVSNGKRALNFNAFYNIIKGASTTTTKTRHSINPSTLESNPEVPVSTQQDIDTAVRAAKDASEGWAEVPVSERQHAVLAFAEALKSHKADFAQMLVKEQGKPLVFANMELDDAYRWLTEQAKLSFPEDIVEETEEKLIVTQYTPLGVALGIVPWNFPILLACGKIAPALISGNSFIMKPSPFTPYCGLKLAELAQGFFPPGVFQALSGDDSLGPQLTSHPGIDKVSFTGSTATGKRVMESCSKTLKRVTLELGGKDPAIICADVDIKEVVPKIAQMMWLNSGQICIAVKRVYVHESIYDEFLSELIKFTKTLQVGDGFQPDVFLGPVQNEMQYERVRGFLADSNERKHAIALGGPVHSASKKNGYFINPTIIDNPPDDSRIVVEEPFGPVVPLMKWSTEDEVLQRANDSLMGLGASIWTKDLEKAGRMARKVKAGSVWVNTHLEIQPTAAFGGHKESGLGAEWGHQGLRSYCNARTLFLKKK